VAGVAGVTGCWRGSDSVAGYGGPRRLVHINMNALAALIKSLCLHLFAPPLPPPPLPPPPDLSSFTILGSLSTSRATNRDPFKSRILARMARTRVWPGRP
jgi:hypothetical protein